MIDLICYCSTSYATNNDLCLRRNHPKNKVSFEGYLTSSSYSDSAIYCCVGTNL